jgi:hypothetical protein
MSGDFLKFDRVIVADPGGADKSRSPDGVLTKSGNVDLSFPLPLWERVDAMQSIADG